MSNGSCRAGLRPLVALSPRLIEGPLPLKIQCLFMGAQNFFSRGEQNHHHKNTTIFRRTAGANENFWVFSRRFRPILKVCIASAEGASENFRVFRSKEAYDHFVKFLGMGQVPLSPCGCPCVWHPGRCFSQPTASSVSQLYLLVFLAAGEQIWQWSLSVFNFQGRGTCYWLQPLQSPMASYLLPWTWEDNTGI